MKVDLHVHTWYSRDSGNSPKLVLKMMNSRGIDAIAVTNHNTTRGWEDFPRSRVIPGIEFSTDKGHLLGLWLDLDYTQPRRLAFDEALDIIRDNSGIAIIAHPFDYRRSWRFDKGYMYYARRVDGIEVCNYKNKSMKGNERARRIAERYGLLMSAGSDAHFPDEVGMVYVESESQDLEEFRGDFLKGRIKIKCAIQPKKEQVVSFAKSIAQSLFSIYGRPMILEP